MSDLFLKIMNMSISASWLVLAVVVLRLVLKKAPKWVSVLLWGIVAVRLICPFSFESVLSLIPSAQTVSPDIMMDPTPQVSTGIESLNDVVNPIISQSFAPEPSASANPLQILIPVAAIIWLAGAALMLIYTAVSYWLLRRKVSTAVLLRDNLFQSENVDSPFVLGIIRPRIYLPFNLDGQSFEHVVAHELAHIRRKDHWWKPIGFLLLAIHWFNPLMWLAYILLCRDIELACDEKVIGKLDNESKADYTQALVACSVNRRSIAACPLAFGEVGIKDRVKSVMNYRKPAFWIVVAAVVICAVVAVCFLTNPKTTSFDVLPYIHSHAYEVTEVAYEDGMYSFSVVAGENSPVYAITEDMRMASQKEHSNEGVWTQLGKLEETELTKENFDDYFHTDGWSSNVNAKTIRKNTENAWQLIYNQDVLYYVLQQKNGDLYLAFGYYDYSEKDDPGSDGTHFRWLYKLTIDETAEKGIVAKSGDNTVPLISFPAGTAIRNYTNSIYWLTIHPDDAEFLPFTLWRDGKEVRGFYNAFDAETFEPIGYFAPSGLDPQTYIFQNAEPARAYIVLAVFSTDANAEIYAFGVKFGSTVSSVGGADDSEVTNRIDEALQKKIRKELDLPSAQKLTYAGEYSINENTLLWIYYETNGVKNYVPVGCSQKSSGEYKFKEIYRTMTYTTDIVHTVWMGEDIYLINNPNCKSIIYKDKNGNIVQQIDIGENDYPYVFHLSPPVNPCTCTFADANGNDLQFSTQPEVNPNDVTFVAEILEIHDGYFLVKPESGWDAGGADLLEVPMENMAPSPEPMVGDNLIISCDGVVMETYPVRLANVTHMNVISLSELSEQVEQLLQEVDEAEKQYLREVYLGSYRPGHLQITSGGQAYEPFISSVYGDAALKSPEEVKQAGLLPSIPYCDDFEVVFTKGGWLDFVIWYDENHQRQTDEWSLDFLSSLESGTYYIDIIILESAFGEERNQYSCMFEFVVP